MPDAPAPDHDTDQRTVAVAVNASPGWRADERGYTYPQSGDATDGSPPGRYTVPGPGHCTVEPSPIDHDTETGRAVAVTDTPATDAVADTGDHDSNHSHVGNPTS